MTFLPDKRGEASFVSLLGVGLLVLLGSPPIALAQPCESGPGAPLLVARPPANFGTLPPACPGTDASLISGAALLVDRGDYYGALWAGSTLAGRAAITDSLWVSAVVPGIEHRFVANAVIEASHTGLGAGNLGVHASLPAGDSMAFAPFARALLPTESVYRHARRHGGELGSSAVWRTSARTELAGGLTVPVLVTVNGPWREVLVQPLAGADVFFQPRSWISLGAGAAARLNATERDESLEAIEARAGVRVFPWRGARAELVIAAPRYGRDRTDAAVSLSLGWTWP